MTGAAKKHLREVIILNVLAAIALGLIFGHTQYHWFTKKDEVSFLICERDLFFRIGEDHEPDFVYSSTPQQTYEVVCGYRAGVGNQYGTLGGGVESHEDGRLVSKDRPIGGKYVATCLHKEPPHPKRSNWVDMGDGSFCPMVPQGRPVPRS